MRDGWVEEKLGAVVDVINGGTPPTSEDSFWGGDIVWVTTTELTASDGKKINLSKRTITEEGLRSGATRMVRAGATLLGTTATIGTCAMAGRALTFNQQISGLLPKTGDLEDAFLFLSVQSMKPELENLSAGTSFKRISTSVLKSVQIRLPPVPDQKRIVDLIAAFDSYIDSLQQQVYTAKNARSAVLQGLLASVGPGWVSKTLSEIAWLNPEQARDAESNRFVRYIDLSSVSVDYGIDPEIEEIPFSKAPNRARRVVREGDVIVSTVRPYLRGNALVGGQFDGQIASTGFCVIRAQPDLVLSSLVWAIVCSDDFAKFLIGRSTGSSYPAVRADDIGDFPVMLPPRRDQEAISQMIGSFDRLIWDLSNLARESQGLRSALLAELLSGNHVIPETYDELIGAA
jgi:type I restriction enzyme S subunit